MAEFVKDENPEGKKKVDNKQKSIYSLFQWFISNTQIKH